MIITREYSQAIGGSMSMSTPDQSTQRYGDPKERTSNPARRKGMLSTGLMKSGCPSCLIAGLAIWPIELAAKGAKKIIAGPNPDATRH